MAPIHPDRLCRDLLSALTAVAMLCLQPAFAAAVSQERIVWSARDGIRGNFSTVLSIGGPEVRQGTTFLRALKADATGLENGPENSTWKFSGDVHLEFDGAVVDTQSATVVFVNGRLNSVDIQTVSAQPKKPVHVEFDGAMLDADTATVAFTEGRVKTIQVRGAPAQFSHQLKKTGRRTQGRANRIDYDAGKSLMRLTDDIWFSDGRNEVKAQWLNYNLDDGVFDAAPGSSGTHWPDERVPAPRTPDRATAK
jgi:lipopolysaccharide transport protein LptA